MGQHSSTRRSFLQATGGLVGSAWLSNHLHAEPAREKLPVAGVATVWRKNSHADVLLTKIFEGYNQDGGPGPDLRLASLYLDQTPANDLGRELAAKHGVHLAKSIEEAITLGKGEVSVRGVLNIGEHGDYPSTPDTKQHMYPRRRFFDEVVATFRKYKQVVPLFSDKHLAYNWADAKHMYDTAKEMKVPFLAGSSVPVGWRVPPLSLPMDCQIEEALSIGYGGLESYGFHAIEGLQCMVERRKGGETGVTSVRAVSGDEIWKAERDGLWSRSLLEAALSRLPTAKKGEPEKLLRANAAFYLIEYRDGLKATVAMCNGIAGDFAFAGKLKGEPQIASTWYQLQDGRPYGHFAYQLRAIDHLVHTGKPPYPVERTLLTTGILDAAMHSLAQGGQRRETPYLDVRYTAVDWPYAAGEAPAASG